MKKVLFVPVAEKNNGTGHLKRTIKWVKSILSESAPRSEDALRYEPFIYIPIIPLDNNGKEEQGHVWNPTSFPDFKEIEKSIVSDLSGKYDVAVFDMRKTNPLLIKKLEKIAEILVSVDEGGKERENFDYLIDTLPNTVSKAAPPNIFSTDLLGYKDKRNNRCEMVSEDSLKLKKYNNILISFGGEDSKGITKKFLDKVQKKNIFKDMNVTVVIGPFFKDKNYIKNNFGFFNIAESPASLENLIEESDIVFTSFGLTAYEALYAGKDLLLINPSKYHRKLSKLAGFCEAGIINPNIKKIEKIINNPGYCQDYKGKNRSSSSSMYNSPQLVPLTQTCVGTDSNFVDSGQSLNINELFLKIAETEKVSCPVCKGKGKIYKRYIYKNYLKCENCGIVYLQNIGKNEKKYEKSYFFEEYKKQYGKTYIEDFNNISAASQKRVNIIKNFVKKGKALDIGCAYGPFLNVMKDQYECYGIDISEDAVEYVNKNLGIKAVTGDFSLSDFIPVFPGDVSQNKKEECLKFDIITMWYVIEHFKNVGEVIEKIGKLINKSGIFAFSTPNLSGISSIYNKNKFLESSPSDHYTLWNILSAKHILSQFGFKVVKVRCTGHHPERFPLLLQKILGFKILSLISRFFRLGDTFEIYARRKNG
ncbi:MAG: methyltransferase domain-containing protein [Spirochaetaceae bacterium]|nr:methyltransferase domain-containing protein [Spirochaetaceae bacterium]